MIGYIQPTWYNFKLELLSNGQKNHLLLSMFCSIIDLLAHWVMKRYVVLGSCFNHENLRMNELNVFKWWKNLTSDFVLFISN